MPSGNSGSRKLEEAKRTSVKPVEHKLLESKTSLRDRHKRPDKQIYVPRALRGTRNTEELLSDDKDRKKEKRTSIQSSAPSSYEEKPELETIKSASEVQKITETLSPGKIPVSDEISTANSCQEDEVLPDLTLHDALLSTQEDAVPISPNALSRQPDRTCSVDKQTKLFSKVFVDNPTNEDISQPVTSDSLATSSENFLNACAMTSEDANELDASISDSSRNELPLKSAESHTVLHVSETVREDTVFESKELYANLEISQQTNELAMDVCVSDRHEKSDSEKGQDTNERHLKVKDAKMSIDESDEDKIMCDVSSAEKEDSWECKFNDDGECLSPEFVKELINVTGRMETLVAKNSFSKFQPSSEKTMEGYDTIVELYNFPQEFKTQDLVSALSFFMQSSYTIKWVDDIHALAIFTSPALANQALQLKHPLMKVRPISEGIKESKSKARWCETHLEPPKPRPTTSAVLARRLVSGALGLRVQSTKEQRDYERNVLNQARERRRQKSKQKQDIWNGVVS